MSPSWFSLAFLVMGIFVPGVASELRGEEPVGPARWKGVYLSRQSPMNTPAMPGKLASHTGLLAREIIRQAVLMSAREEFGLVTRDETLGDPKGDGEWLTLETMSEVLLDGSATYQISCESEKVPFDSFAQLKFRHLSTGLDYGDLSRVCLESARKDVAKGLEGVGFSRRDPSLVAANRKELPDEVRKLVAHFSPLSQFAAVRRLHSDMAKDGATPAHFAALSEAYTNLGVLCHPLWLSQTEAFLARGLLYADRVLESDPTSPQGDWSKAYALAMMGCYPLARESIASAEKKSGARASTPAAWESLLLPLVEGDWQGIEAAVKKGKPGFEWGEWARWRSMGGDFWMGRRVAEVARDHVESNGPLCVPLTFQLFHSSAINNSHLAMRSFLPALADETERYVSKLVSLPDSIADDVQEGPAGLLSTTQKLIELAAKDRAEPSTAALALLIEDLVLSHSVSTLRFMKERWGVPWGDYYAMVEPLVRHHPYRSFLSLAGGLDTDDPTELASRYLKEPRLDHRFPMISATHRLYGVKENGRDIGQTIWHSIVSGRDYTGLDMVDYINGLGDDRDKLKQHKAYIELAGARPFCVASIAKFERSTGDVSKEVLADTVGRHPESATLLAEAFMHMQEIDWGVRTYRQALDVDGEPTTFLKLAEIHQAQVEPEKWRAVLEEMLQQPEQDLSHANARIQIAEYYIDRNEFKEAMPYADEAATTFMARGLICAYICADGSGLYPKAEGYLRALSGRYPSEGLQWYLWCQRSGKGDIKSAREVMSPILQSLRQRTDAESQRVLALIYEMEEESDRARLAWETAYQRQPSPLDLVGLLIDAHEQKDQERIKSWEAKINDLAKLENQDVGEAEEFAILGKAIVADSRGEANQVSPELVKEWVKELSLAESAAIRCLAARYLVFCGRKDEALSVLEPAIKWRRTSTIWQTRAAKLGWQIRGETHEGENDDPKI
ncbi:hypothetical protein K2X85_13800 [bacterium]|nr:hypothetical protein [bacterium]